MRSAIAKLIDELIEDLAMERALANSTSPELEETYGTTIRRLEEIRGAAESESSPRIDCLERGPVHSTVVAKTEECGAEGGGSSRGRKGESE